jgi:hypothetical protein
MIFYAMGRIKVVAAAGVYRDTEKTHIAKASWLTKAYQATRYGHASNKTKSKFSGECLESAGVGTTDQAALLSCATQELELARSGR